VTRGARAFLERAQLPQDERRALQIVRRHREHQAIVEQVA